MNISGLIRILSIFTVILFSQTCRIMAIDFEGVLNLGLNVLYIETENSEEPTCEYVSAPSGSMGKTIKNATKVPGSVKVYSPSGEILYNSGEYEKGEAGMTIKIRGNTSAYTSKKPFKIKLQKKADLLIRGDKNYNDKNWVLLNDNHLRLYTGFEVSRLLEEEWTPAGMYVNVWMNGTYRGLYYLVESVERNEKSRINVSESGFVVEHDAYWWNESGEYVKSEFDPLLNYTFKYPDYEDLTDGDLAHITLILQKYEFAMRKSRNISEIDHETFAKWLLGHDILGTWDGGGANFYLSRYDLEKGSLIKAGPMWDFDTIELQENEWSGLHTAFDRFEHLFYGKSPFTKVYKELWQKKGRKVLDGLLALIEDYRDESKWESYNLSSEATSKFWGGASKASVAADREEAWVMSRFEWLKEQIGEFEEDTPPVSGIDDIKSEGQELFDVYNLQGVKIKTRATKDEIGSLRPGVYIIGGRKVAVR